MQLAKELAVCVGEDNTVVGVEPGDELEVFITNAETGKDVSVFGTEHITIGDACRRIAIHADLVRDLEFFVGAVSRALITVEDPLTRTVYAGPLDRARKTLAAARDGALLVAA